MFGKKKKEIPASPLLNFTEWNSEFGFLQLILTRKKAITKEFIINTLQKQLPEKTEYLRDEDIMPLVNDIVEETIEMLSPEYKRMLITKYFKDENQLISYLVEDVVVDLMTEAINSNHKKLSFNLAQQKTKQILDLNNKNLKMDKKQ